MNIKNMVNKRFEEILNEYNHLNEFLKTRKVVFVEEVNGNIEIISEEDFKYKKFCSGVFEKDSLIMRIFSDFIENKSWIEEISIIFKDELNEKDEKELFRKNYSAYRKTEGRKGIAFVILNKRWKKAKVYVVD